ncbi:hypothetical protein [Kamptonema formosum]|uniref:hypothetical protein n=1 Tax=Kamptonema formosum TaxID=331992 RepID=UPI0002FE29B1|nr:hypothetical protein [Kamptonema formosum]
MKKLASFVGIAGFASLLSTPGLVQINSRANIANPSFRGIELQCSRFLVHHFLMSGNCERFLFVR